MSFSIRLTDDERALVDSYAKLHSMTVGEAFKTALFDKIDEEYDWAVSDSAFAKYEAGHDTVSHEDAWKEILS